MKSTAKPPRKHAHNVVELNAKKAVDGRKAAADFTAKAGPGTRAVRKPDDARVKEAMRLAQAFLAIEDAAARGALVALAERLVSYDWIRKVQ